MKTLTLILNVLFCFLLLSCGGNQLISKKKLEAKNYQNIYGQAEEQDLNVKTIESSSNLDDVIAEEDDEKKIQKVPMYPNGQRGIKMDVARKFRYPSNLSSGIKGKIILRFTIDTKGYVDDVVIVEKLHPLLDQEAIRAVKKLDRFMPGFVDDKPVRVVYTLPINLR